MGRLFHCLASKTPLMPLISLQPAKLAFTDNGVPYSLTYDDIYHSRDEGMPQAGQVFLAGNRLPGRWQQREHFVIVETGFGLGLNFLFTWAAWRADPQRCRKLHFISIEKHPFVAADMVQLLGQWPELHALAGQLLQQWPCLTPGSHRLQFEQGQVVLTLIFDDVVAALKNLHASVDAIYLDGFAPRRNPDMWSERVFRGLARLAHAGTTLATYTVAATVREGLAHAGFNVQKQPGFGRKQDMLAGEFRVVREIVPACVPHKAIVLGAGLAGCQISAELARRGCHVELIDRLAGPALATSGNWAGCYLPAPSRDDNLASRLTRAGFLALQQRLPLLQQDYPDLSWSACGVLQMARDDADARLQQQVATALQHPLVHLQYLDQEQASAKCGVSVPAGGWWFGSAGWVRPPSLCRALLASGGDSIRHHWNVAITRLQYRQGLWQVWDDKAGCIAQAPVLVLANAVEAATLLPDLSLPLSQIRGQISYLPQGQLPAFEPVLCREGYVLPAVAGQHVLGASYDFDVYESALLAGSQQQNLQRLSELLPGTAEAFVDLPLNGRVGFRCVSSDRMPLAGRIADTQTEIDAGTQLAQMPRQAGLYCLSGLGSRGLVWSGVAAELLVDQICGEPWRLERDLAEALDPARFHLRDLRRSEGRA